MNLEKIKQVLDLKINDEVKRSYILNLIADDKRIFQDLLTILSTERERSRELITDLNIELSKAHIYINDTKTTGGKRTIDRSTILEHITNFYKKNKDIITHHFVGCKWGNENLTSIYEKNNKQSGKNKQRSKNKR